MHLQRSTVREVVGETLCKLGLRTVLDSLGTAAVRVARAASGSAPRQQDGILG